MRKNLLIVIGVALFSLFLFWAPFALRIEKFWGVDFYPTFGAGQRGMATIIQNFDGLNFLVVAKSLYDPKIIDQINLEFNTGNTPIYFSAHFPLFPLIIKFFAIFTSLPKALLLAIIFSNILLACALYLFFATILKNPKLALTMAIIGLFFPARMLSVRAVGSNEPLFIALVLSSLTYAYKKEHGKAAIVGALAVLTRSPGILLFAGYALAAIASYTTDIKRIFKEGWVYLLMPATLIALFGFYAMSYGSPFAYFQSGDNLHLFFPPFQIFSNMQSWISDMWREDIVYLYLFYAFGVALYIKKVGIKCGLAELAPLGYGVLYGLVLLMVAHRDLARYALPLAPVALVGYSEGVEKVSKRGYLILALLLIPIYLFGWQFVIKNVQPINDWSVFVN